MYRGRVFIGGSSPTTLRYYTVMPPNNYIPGIFPGYNRISTSFGKLHPNLFRLLGPLQPIGPRLAHHHSVNKIPFAASEALTLRRFPLLVFDFAICALVFAAGALVFASLRLSLSSPLAPWSSPYAPWSSPLFACLRLRLWRLSLRRRRLGLLHSSLIFIFACGASVFARSLKPFDCSACRAARRLCRCIQIACGPSVDGRRWRPQQ